MRNTIPRVGHGRVSGFLFPVLERLGRAGLKTQNPKLEIRLRAQVSAEMLLVLAVTLAAVALLTAAIHGMADTSKSLMDASQGRAGMEGDFRAADVSECYAHDAFSIPFHKGAGPGYYYSNSSGGLFRPGTLEGKGEPNGEPI
jgi:hypothetical protein